MSVNTYQTDALEATETSLNVYFQKENIRQKETTFKPQDFKMVKQLSDAKTLIYIVTSAQSEKLYAMKVFLWEGERPSHLYNREARFSGFRHKSLISIPYFENQVQYLHNGQYCTVSYILMEYAPYGTFLNAANKIPFHEKLLRTYFHQLIEGLEYLHLVGAAHLDIKPENLLISENYILKIADFDLSYLEDDGEVVTRGTENYRAPEIFHGKCKNPHAADVYSAGIVLFFLKTGGTLPYSEAKIPKGEIDMAVLKEDDPEAFWKNHCQFGDIHPSFFSEDFKSLFLSMTQFNPEKRATIAQIKESKWYRGNTYTQEELADFMKGRLDA